LALVERCLLAATPENALVLDPFLGSGTTAIACLRQHRHCVGIELDPAFIQLAIERIQAERGDHPLAISAAA
jgi:site-specific DNA-methyltransferase (adenine-specific)